MDGSPGQPSASKESPTGPQRAPWGRLVSIGPGNGGTVDLRGNEILLGRSRECSVRLPYAHISGRHCRICRALGSTAFVHDDSTNGTFINGRRVGKGKKMILNDGDQLQLSRQDPIQFLYEDYERKQNALSKYLPLDHAVLQFYDLTNHIGSGKFGEVFFGAHKTTGAQAAVKVIDKKRNGMNALALEFFQREADILKMVKHTNIVSVFDVYDSPSTLCIAFQYCEGGDLFDATVGRGKFPEEEARHIFLQLLHGVRYLHEQKIVHRDLKPENVLLETKGANPHIRITDFGMAKMLGGSSFVTSTLCGTPQYVAPEVLRKAEDTSAPGYGVACDLWSLGALLYFILFGRPPFQSEGAQLLESIKNAEYSIPQEQEENVSPEAKDLIKGLLNTDPAARLTAEEALKHPWVFRLDPLPAKDPAPAKDLVPAKDPVKWRSAFD
eukprot:m51a1_g1190 putative protein serine threonine kinase (440) ;mRNA; f:420644-422711